MNPSDASALCLECGLCCNGVIFADVRLQPGDDAQRLRSLGLPVRASAAAKVQKFPQPCALLEGCKCRGYGERRKYCREFECVLLKSVKAGRMKKTAAREIIATARRRADKVRSLLAELGDTNAHLALAARF